jgi:large subunit ribosomal protein L1
VGKVSFPPEQLIENTKVLIAELLRAKPAASKGQYIKSMTLSSTMGPGIMVDYATEVAALKV